jgi:hypothetical protein
VSARAPFVFAPAFAFAFACACACALALGLAAASPAGAGPLGAWLEAGVVGGMNAPDASLRDYQWDVSPHAAFGAQAMAGLGKHALGLRWSRSGTTQSLGEGASVATADVSLTGLELVARAQVVRAATARLYATGTAGRLRLGYDPENVTIDVPGTGPVDVALAPVDTWAFGGGLGVEHPLGTRWTGALEVTRRFFSLETAHRNGSEIEYGRQGFGEWNARFVLGWRIRT